MADSKLRKLFGEAKVYGCSQRVMSGWGAGWWELRPQLLIDLVSKAGAEVGAVEVLGRLFSCG